VDCGDKPPPLVEITSTYEDIAVIAEKHRWAGFWPDRQATPAWPSANEKIGHFDMGEIQGI
jgi:hypothetical protein